MRCENMGVLARVSKRIDHGQLGTKLGGAAYPRRTREAFVKSNVDIASEEIQRIANEHEEAKDETCQRLPQIAGMGRWDPRQPWPPERRSARDVSSQPGSGWRPVNIPPAVKPEVGRFQMAPGDTTVGSTPSQLAFSYPY
jgi:hypothetical protein